MSSERIHARYVSEHIGEQVTLKGWAQTIRDQGKIAFVVLRDVTDTVQLVITKNDDTDVLETVQNLSTESVIEVTGTAQSSDQAPGGREVKMDSLTVLSAAADLPIPVVEKEGETPHISKRLDYRWVDLRKEETRTIFEVWTEMERAFEEFCRREGFIDEKAYLSQSPQFYKQMAMAAGFENVFEVGAVFRAEKSFTPRHATEFTGFDVEMSFIEGLHDLISWEERMLVYVLEQIQETYGERIKELYGTEIVVPEIPFPRISMNEAKAILAERDIPSKSPVDVSPEEERALGEYAQEEYGHEFVFLTEYSTQVRPFYHMRSENNVTKSADLLYRGLEITTLAQREHRPEVLKQQAQEKGIDPQSVDYYIDFFRYGCPPHGGMGIGPSRIIKQMLGLESIREATYLFRGPKRMSP
ncbi:MAG: aspartate--tRNA(Asn) ligase [Parcubacteria group bacterium SW_4_49_11]|nr:MAG: aspartate--tRNA(Asn) ligase [Parcubacteria group bacterium SW_4_49_11]